MIRALQQKGHEVHVASDGLALEWLKKELPDVQCHELPKAGFHYPSTRWWVNSIFLLPAFIRHLFQDYRNMGKLIKKTGARALISDNRFMFRHGSADINIYISHQITIYHPIRWVSYLLSRGHQWFICRFDVCWIPDDPEERLAGILSAKPRCITGHYMGILSRLGSPDPLEKDIDVLFTLSGPEPQRSLFEKMILQLCTGITEKKICLIRGSTTTFVLPNSIPNLEVIHLADTNTIKNRLSRASCLVTRPGYSTLMDIHAWPLQAVLVPTPGQTEQEYLAENVSFLFEKYTLIYQDNFEKTFLYILEKMSARHEG